MDPRGLIMCVGGPGFLLLLVKTLPGNRAYAASIYDVIYTPYCTSLHIHTVQVYVELMVAF